MSMPIPQTKEFKPKKSRNHAPKENNSEKFVRPEALKRQQSAKQRPYVALSENVPQYLQKWPTIQKYRTLHPYRTNKHRVVEFLRVPCLSLLIPDLLNNVCFLDISLLRWVLISQRVGHF